MSYIDGCIERSKESGMYEGGISRTPESAGWVRRGDGDKVVCWNNPKFKNEGELLMSIRGLHVVDEDNAIGLYTFIEKAPND